LSKHWSKMLKIQMPHLAGWVPTCCPQKAL
jgi:hypothetical protein